MTVICVTCSMFLRSDQLETFELLGDDVGEPDLNLEQVCAAYN